MNEQEEKQLERLEKHFNRPMLSKDNVSNYLNISLGGLNNIMDNGEIKEIRSLDDIKLKYIKFGSDKRCGVRVFIEDFAEYLAKVELFNGGGVV